MKKALLLIFFLIFLFAGCDNEKKQDFFKGTVSEITQSYIIVTPNDGDPIKEIGDTIYVPKTVVSKDLPELTLNENVQIVYRGYERFEDAVKLDIVFAIYKESDLKELNGTAEWKDNGVFDLRISWSKRIL